MTIFFSSHLPLTACFLFHTTCRMVIYEVNLTLKASIADEFRRWLKNHIQEILRLDGFLSADWFDVGALHAAPASGMEEPANAKHWTIQYRLKDQISLDNYFKNHAPRLRQEGLDRFGSQFQASRRVMTLAESL